MTYQIHYPCVPVRWRGAMIGLAKFGIVLVACASVWALIIWALWRLWAALVRLGYVR